MHNLVHVNLKASTFSQTMLAIIQRWPEDFRYGQPTNRSKEESGCTPYYKRWFDDWFDSSQRIGLTGGLTVGFDRRLPWPLQLHLQFGRKTAVAPGGGWNQPGTPKIYRKEVFQRRNVRRRPQE